MVWLIDQTPIIVGAGIAGLSSALALANKGINTLVLETRDKLTEVGAGIQLAPNATRLLKTWGVLEQLMKVGVQAHFLELRDGMSAKKRLRVNLEDVSQRRWHSPYLTIHRADLQKILFQKAQNHPLIDIRLGEKVIAATKAAPNIAEIQVEHNGAQRIFSTPLIIGCDGIWSKLRQFPPLNEHASFTGYIAWRGTVNVDKLPKDLVDSFIDMKTVTAWMGPRNHLVAYPLQSGKSFNFVAITEGDDPGRFWSRAGEKKDLINSFKIWHPAVRAIFNTVDKLTFWPLFQMQKHRFFGKHLRVFVGDASHGFLPFAAQGAAMAIEDAAALAEVLKMGNLDLMSQIKLYENVRKARVDAVNKRGAFNRFVYHATGPVAAARNIVMKLGSPERFMAHLDWLYGYDATAFAKNQ